MVLKRPIGGTRSKTYIFLNFSDFQRARDFAKIKQPPIAAKKTVPSLLIAGEGKQPPIGIIIIMIMGISSGL